MKRFELRSRRLRLAVSSLAAIVALGAAGCNDRPATPGEPRVANGGPIGAAVAASTGSTSAEACVTIQRGGGVGNVFDSGINDNGVSSNNSSGISSTIPIGESGSPATARQELMSFDLSPIPRGAGDTVVGAQVSLYVYPSSANQTINVHQATAAWSETTVSWPSFNESFVAAPVTSFTTGAANPWNPLSHSPAPPNNTRFDVTSLVSGWLNGTLPNDGIVLEQAPAAGVSTIVLSSEWPPALSGYHPTLFVCFTVTCAAGTADCNNNGLDGCETNITTAQNCGACGVACPAGATCQAGACVGANACTNVVCTASDSCHVAGTCDPSTGQCSNPPAANGTACNDGNACTQTDTCQSGVCTGSNPVVCTASDPCHTAGTCDPSTGTCSNPPAANGTGCNDGNACTTGDACQNGVCTGTAVTCTASDPCHAAGTCDPSTGACSNPAAANGTACDDGNACTTGDACQNGVCTGTAVTCTASDPCHTAGTCDPSTGTCSNPAAANGTGCDDGNACTTGDACQGGVCVGGAPVVCTASDACHVAGACDPSTGACANPAAPDGTTCGDGNPCHVTRTCQGGACEQPTAQALYSCASQDNQLRTIDLGSATTLSSTPMTIAGDTITGCNGLSADANGQLWGIVKLASGGSRRLVEVGTDGTATLVGSLGDNYASLAFGAGGTLFAATGNNAKVAGGTLFTVSTSTAKTTELLALAGFGAAGGCGQALGFDPADGLLHYMTTTAYLTVDTGSSAVTSLPFPAPLQNSDCVDDEALAWWPAQSAFLVAYGYSVPATLYTLDATGVASAIGPLDHVAKGLALVSVSGPTVVADGSPCPGGACQAGTCQQASCTDGIQNQGEQGVDCGGPCPPCNLCSSTFTGSGSATFGFLGFVAVDAQGDVFVADSGNNQVHEVTPGGQVLTFGSGVSGYADGPAASAQFAYPQAVAVDAQGNVLVADSDNAVIRSIAPDGTVSTVAGTPGVSGHVDGPAASAELVWPTDIVLDPQGNLYIVDYDDATVRMLDTSGNLTTIAGTPGVWGHVDGPAASAQFAGLEGVAIDAQGNLYVAEWDEHDIRKIDASGNVTTVAGVPGKAGAQDGPAASALFDGLVGIAVDAQGGLLVADDNAATIRRVSPGGVVSTIAGSAYNHDTPDGCAAHLPLNAPGGVAIAADGTIHFTDNTSLRTLALGGCDCTVPTCFDGIQDEGETGVDCGGPCALVCPTCSDGIQNEGELSIDCGGPCPLCAPGTACTVDAACAGGVCRLHQCQAPTCLDGVQNQGETDVDCGGPCPLCAAGSACTVGASCVSQVCASGQCTQATCSDGIKNAGEVDVDCAGPCPLCGAGTACTQGAACASGVCTGGACQDPTCFDGVQNGGEIDVDCGGACGPCPVGEHCITGTDCATGVCQGLVCRPATCGDGARDGSESDVDCGGPCAGCASGQACGTAADCASNRCVGGVCNPRPAAPPNDPTLPNDMVRSTAFLYSGSSPVQTSVAPAALDTRRLGVVRGQVIDRSGAPVSDVALRVLGHPELGVTYTRADGAFDMAVNGGGPVTLIYDKPGLISAQREVVVPWLDFVAAPSVVMIGLDPAMTTVDLTDESSTQVARGSVVVDHDGARQATTMFAPGTTADMLLPDGTRRRLTSISLRATEFTVGVNGAQTMPAALPPSSAYTYAVDMSADQAVLAGAKALVFSQPVAVYLDDFLHFPVGQVVPVGYYDTDQGAWVASGNGLIVQVLDVAGGLADLDIDGSGAAASPAALASLGVTDGERAELAALYAPGTILWRSPMSHFSLIDYNWPYGFPPGATPPPPPPTDPPPKPDCDSGASGSIIECESQVLGEELKVEGTPFKLEYSSRALTERSIDFTISGATVPSSLKRIDLLISVAGQSQTLSFPPAPNQTYHYTWNGKDAYGRLVTGVVQPTANLHYVYPMTYYSAPSAYYASFAQFPGVSLTTSYIWGGERVYTGDVIGGRDWPGQQASEIFSNVAYPTPQLHGGDTDLGLGGWTLDAHQSWDPLESTCRHASLSIL